MADIDITPELGARMRWMEHQLLRLDGLCFMRDYAEMQRRIALIKGQIAALPDRPRLSASGTRLSMLGVTVTNSSGAPMIWRAWIDRARLRQAAATERKAS